MFEILVDAMSVFFTLSNVLAVALGLIIGIVIGAIPGLNVPMIVALLLPITFYMDPITGLSLLLGVYKGGTYGGSISAVLINTPGAPAAACTQLDGYPMALKGQGGKALQASIYGSVIGELIADILLIALATQIARFALKFGPNEKFSLVFFALVTIGVVSGQNRLKGIAAGLIGLFIYSIGIEPISDASRFIFGNINFYGGIPFLPMLIGLFGVSEFFVQIEKKAVAGLKETVIPISKNREDNVISMKEFKANIWNILRSSFIGIGIGALPGSGSSISAYVAYGAARNASKDPDSFGQGALEGVIAPETANNAAVGGALIPLLTLGIPGDAITAILLGVFLIHGIVPGPELFTKSADLVYQIFISLMVGNVLHLVIAQLGLKLFMKMIQISKAILFPIIIVLCIFGAYSVGTSMFDVYVMLFFGILGYIMKKLDIPTAPLLMGHILGSLFEKSLVQSLILSKGSIVPFFTRPISLFFLLLTVFFIFWSGFSSYLRKKKNARSR